MAVPGVAGAVVTEFRTDRGVEPAVVASGKITPAGPQLPRAGHPDGVLVTVNP